MKIFKKTRTINSANNFHHRNQTFSFIRTLWAVNTLSGLNHEYASRTPYCSSSHPPARLSLRHTRHWLPFLPVHYSLLYCLAIYVMKLLSEGFFKFKWAFYLNVVNLQARTLYNYSVRILLYCIICSAVGIVYFLANLSLDEYKHILFFIFSCSNNEIDAEWRTQTKSFTAIPQNNYPQLTKRFCWYVYAPTKSIYNR